MWFPINGIVLVFSVYFTLFIFSKKKYYEVEYKIKTEDVFGKIKERSIKVKYSFKILDQENIYSSKDFVDFNKEVIKNKIREYLGIYNSFKKNTSVKKINYLRYNSNSWGSWTYSVDKNIENKCSCEILYQNIRCTLDLKLDIRNILVCINGEILDCDNPFFTDEVSKLLISMRKKAINFSEKEDFAKKFINEYKDKFESFDYEISEKGMVTLIINLKDPFTKHKFISDLSDYVRNSDKFLFRKILEVKLNRLNNPSITDDDRIKILYEPIENKYFEIISECRDLECIHTFYLKKDCDTDLIDIITEINKGDNVFDLIRILYEEKKNLGEESDPTYFDIYKIFKDYLKNKILSIDNKEKNYIISEVRKFFENLTDYDTCKRMTKLNICKFSESVHEFFSRMYDTIINCKAEREKLFYKLTLIPELIKEGLIKCDFKDLKKIKRCYEEDFKSFIIFLLEKSSINVSDSEGYIFIRNDCICVKSANGYIFEYDIVKNFKKEEIKCSLDKRIEEVRDENKEIELNDNLDVDENNINNKSGEESKVEYENNISKNEEEENRVEEENIAEEGNNTSKEDNEGAEVDNKNNINENNEVKKEKNMEIEGENEDIEYKNEDIENKNEYIEHKNKDIEHKNKDIEHRNENVENEIKKTIYYTIKNNKITYCKNKFIKNNCKKLVDSDRDVKKTTNIKKKVSTNKFKNDDKLKTTGKKLEKIVENSTVKTKEKIKKVRTVSGSIDKSRKVAFDVKTNNNNIVGTGHGCCGCNSCKKINKT